MAKKKEKQELDPLGLLMYAVKAICVILIFVAKVILHLVPIFVPCYIVITGIIAWIKYKKKDLLHIKRKFQFDENETLQLYGYHQKLETAINKKKEINRIIEEEHLHINKDGRISSRSYRGADVQGALDAANETIAEVQPKADYLLSLPMQRYKNARKDYLRFKGFIFSFIAWPIAYLPCLSADFRQMLVIKAGNKCGEISFFESPETLPMLWFCFIVMFSVYIITRLIARIYFGIKNKKPKL